MRSSIAFFFWSSASFEAGALGFFARPLRSASVCPALRGSAAAAALASLPAGMVCGVGLL